MGILEEGFSRLHWPPLVRNVVQTAYYPGFRYEFFRSFRELDAYFTDELGAHWRKEPWAEYWMKQHGQTKREDKKDADPRQRKSTGPRRDMEHVTSVAHAHIVTNPRISSYKLVDYLKTQDVHITQKTAWSLIRKWKDAQG